MDEPRDMSDRAILERYSKANVAAIMMSDRIAFDSLRDVFALVKEREELNKKINSLFEAIKHGDEEHQSWLAKAIIEHFKL